ncbi:hypothetical protein OF83DRAFT_1169867 [Amylostereum chailletii]|nr:hypothetical protein OF83DRAFT_1169867 [Amylostereum chailletii]
MAQPVNIIDSSFLSIFEVLPSEQQRQAIDALKTYRERVKNGTDAERRAMGLSAAGSGSQAEVDKQIEVALDTINWQLCQCHRYSKPSRMTEAEPYIRAVLAQYDKKHKDGSKDATPMLYLAVALHGTPGKEEEALSLLNDGLGSNSNSSPGPNTFLWAQAAISRMLRRVNRVDEASNWILGHPYAMPPSKLRQITDDIADPEAPNFVFEHPEVQKLHSNTIEMPGMGGFSSMMMMTH